MTSGSLEIEDAADVIGAQLCRIFVLYTMNAVVRLIPDHIIKGSGIWKKCLERAVDAEKCFLLIYR